MPTEQEKAYLERAERMLRMYKEATNKLQEAGIVSSLATYMRHSRELEEANAEIVRLRAKFDELDAWIGW